MNSCTKMNRNVWSQEAFARIIADNRGDTDCSDDVGCDKLEHTGLFGQTMRCCLKKPYHAEKYGFSESLYDSVCTRKRNAENVSGRLKTLRPKLHKKGRPQM